MALDVKNHDSLATSLVSYWKLDEPSGTRYDVAGSNDLTDNNSVTSTTGKKGTGADFDSANSEFLNDTSASGITGTTANSISVWIKPETVGTYGVFTYQASGTDIHCALYLVSDGSLDFRHTSSGTLYNATTAASTITAGNWYHIVGTFSTTNGTRLYVNAGTPDTDANTGTTDSSTGSELTVGARWKSSTNDIYFNGIIDEVGYWTKELTSDEVTDLYNGGLGIPYDAQADVATHPTLPTSLVSYWEMEETSGTRVDSHGSNDLTDNNTVQSEAGVQGTGALFDGSTEYLTNASSTIAAGDISYSAWIKQDATGNDFICGDIDAAATNSTQFTITTGNKIFFRWWDNSTNNSSRTGTTALAVDTWYHVVASVDVSAGASGIKLYVNGVEEAYTGSTNNATSKNAHSSTFYVGANYAGAYFDGTIDEVGMWNKALTAQEVSDLYNNGSGIQYDAGGAAATTYNALSMCNF